MIDAVRTVVKMNNLKIIKILLISISLFCTKEVARKDFNEVKEEYFKLHQMVCDQKFKTIYINDIFNDQKIGSPLCDSIHKKMVILKISEITKNEFGIYYIFGKSALGKDGYLYTELPTDSLKYLEILTQIENNWYHWYQD
jgi:hypothetical protein